jgi:hypothetical protein
MMHRFKSVLKTIRTSKFAASIVSEQDCGSKTVDVAALGHNDSESDVLVAALLCDHGLYEQFL